MRYRAQLAWLLALALPGCLTYDRVDYALSVRKDASGQAVVHFHGVHSDAAEPEKQAAEMAAFYDGDHVVVGQKFLAESRLSQGSVEILNKSNVKCDVRVTGSFGTLFDGLAGLMQQCDFEVSRKEDVTSIRLQPKEGGLKAGRVTLVYGGEVVAHNAPEQDRRNGALAWDLANLPDGTLSFALRR
jgi:hypothetical protein